MKYSKGNIGRIFLLKFEDGDLMAVVFELKGIKASKDIDPRTGLNLLRI